MGKQRFENERVEEERRIKGELESGMVEGGGQYEQNCRVRVRKRVRMTMWKPRQGEEAARLRESRKWGRRRRQRREKDEGEG